MVEEINVEDVMSKDLISVPPDSSVRDAAQLLIEKGISSLVVIDSGEVVGIVTDRDFVKMDTLDDHPNNVGEIMSKDLITIGPDKHVLEAVRLMGKHNIRHLVVTDEEKHSGIISLRDILKIEPEAIYGYVSQKR